ncbi:MAG: type II toxin-antitoxin system Phd/YefM family antitoxin [Synechococcus lacustris]
MNRPGLNAPLPNGPQLTPRQQPLWWSQPELLDASRNAISKTRFKAQALELFRQVEATGSPLVISDHGRPCLEIRPYSPPNPANPLEQLRGSLRHFHDPLLPPT